VPELLRVETLTPEAVMVPFAGLLAALDRIPDPRRRQGRRYGLAHLLLFSVLAVLAGATSYRRIRLFIGAHRERLNATFDARFRRAPAVNTLRALLHALDPAELEAAFRRHAERLDDTPTSPGRRVVALDGKTLRGSFDHLDDQAAAQVLSAFASEAALILAHQEIAEGDEVAAAQALIEQLGLRGVLFTADALHCQKNRPAKLAGRVGARSRSGRGARPLGPFLDRHRDHRPGRRPLAVLRVLGGEQLHGPAIVHDPRRSAQAHPPEPRPVVLVVVDQHLDPRVRLDVREPLQSARSFRLLVHGRVQRVALDREADRDDVRAAVGANGRQPRDGRLLRRRQVRAGRASPAAGAAPCPPAG